MTSQQQQNMWEDHQTILRRNPTIADEKSEPIPVDLIIDMFLRLPVRCIARCRCLSKLWASILRSPYFTDLYLKKSSARPKLLLACQNHSELIFFSARQPPQIPDESSSSPLAASYQMRFPLCSSYDIISPINGFFLIRDKQILKGRRNQELVSVICNPSTGQSLTLPKPKTRKKVSIRSYFGYDPIEKQFKVLSLTWSEDNMSKEHQVLTLGGTEKPSWRMIECGIPHVPSCDSVCINGVLYYLTYMENDMIICFHVRSEKFSFINLFKTELYSRGGLINCNGKLGLLVSEVNLFVSGIGSRFDNYISIKSEHIKMWILQDEEKHEWTKHVYELPPLWKNIIEDERWLLFVGVIGGTNELVLSPRFPSQPYHVFYYNLETRTIRRVEIQGAFNELTDSSRYYNYNIYFFLDHVEDIKFMQAF